MPEIHPREHVNRMMKKMAQGTVKHTIKTLQPPSTTSRGRSYTPNQVNMMKTLDSMTKTMSGIMNSSKAKKFR